MNDRELVASIQARIADGTIYVEDKHNDMYSASILHVEIDAEGHIRLIAEVQG